MQPTAVIGSAVKIYGAHWQHLVSIGLAIFVFVAVGVGLLSLLGAVGALLGVIVLFLGQALLVGSIVKAVEDVQDGRIDFSIGETVAAARPYILPLIGAGIIVGIGVAIGLVLLIAPGIALATVWFVVFPSIVLEKRGVFDALGRSWSLVVRNFWQTLGVLLLTFLIVIVATIIIGIILSPLPNFVGGLLSSLIVNGIIGPFWAVAAVLTFFRLRALEAEAAPAGESLSH